MGLRQPEPGYHFMPLLPWFIHSGHYIAYVYGPPDGLWYQWSDGTITQMESDTVMDRVESSSHYAIYERTN